MVLQTRLYLLALVCTFLGAADLFAQGTREDYERATQVAETAQGLVTKVRFDLHWLANETHCYYRSDSSDGGREFILVNNRTGRKQPAFDHARLAKRWSAILGRELDPKQLPIRDLLLSDDLQSATVWLNQRQAWACNLKTYEMQPSTAKPPESHTARRLAAVRPSRAGGAKTSISFENHSEEDVALWWIDIMGNRQGYGKIPAGGTRDMSTYVGHVWLVTDKQDCQLLIVEATTQDSVADIEVRPKSEPASQRMPAPRGTFLGDPPRFLADDGVEAPTDQSRRKLADLIAKALRALHAPTWQVFYRDHNVWLKHAKTKEEMRLTTDGTLQNGYGGPILYSPNDARAIVMRVQPGDTRSVHYVESSPPDQLQPKLHSYSYLKPGDKLPISKPHLVDLDQQRLITVSDDLFPHPWSIEGLRWEKDSSRFTFLYNQRGHKVLRILAVDAITGQVTPLVNEVSDTFVCYSDKSFHRWLDKTNELIWMSERDGWNHLYLYDALTGQVKNQITSGPWVVRGVMQVDDAKRQIWFRCGGIDPRQDPYHVHYGRVNLDGTDLVQLTAGDGTHKVTFSPNHKFLLDTYSRVDLPPVHELRRSSDGSLVCELDRTDPLPLVQHGLQMPERFTAKGRDSQTDIWGVIWRPSNFDPKIKYPVIENIYAGPQAAYVPKKFAPWHGERQFLAELGFIVVQIDGMGTNYRSKAFHDVCWKNLADAGLPDRILWMQAAAKMETAMDLTRVGIFGGSAGGQNALGALLTHPEFYKVAVADCGCHDNRMDKIWWNEQWMSWPIGPHYEQQSNTTLAPKLQGKLLLTVGEADENVDPASTMQVVNALIKADKDFDLLVIPGGAHGSGESPYGLRRRRDFFVRHLWNLEPRRGD